MSPARKSSSDCSAASRLVAWEIRRDWADMGLELFWTADASPIPKRSAACCLFARRKRSNGWRFAPGPTVVTPVPFEPSRSARKSIDPGDRWIDRVWSSDPIRRDVVAGGSSPWTITVDPDASLAACITYVDRTATARVALKAPYRTVDCHRLPVSAVRYHANGSEGEPSRRRQR